MSISRWPESGTRTPTRSAPPVSVSRSAAIRQMLTDVHVPRHSDAHTIGTACERQPLAAIRQVPPAAHVPRHPDAHTIGTACERTICYGNQHIAAGILDFKTDSIADDTVGHAPQASPGIRTPTGSAPPVSVSRLAAVRQGLPTTPPFPPMSPMFARIAFTAGSRVPVAKWTGVATWATWA